MAVRSQGTEGAIAAAVAASPMAGAAMPLATALDGKTGTSPRFAREDHTHAARLQRTIMTTLPDGTAVWTFARPIVCAIGKAPPISYMVEDTGTPVVVQIVSRAFTTDAIAGTDTHIGVSVKAQRSRTVPALVASLAGTLGYDVFGAAAPGVKVNLFAADPTQ